MTTTPPPDAGQPEIASSMKKMLDGTRDNWDWCLDDKQMAEIYLAMRALEPSAPEAGAALSMINGVLTAAIEEAAHLKGFEALVVLGNAVHDAIELSAALKPPARVEDSRCPEVDESMSDEDALWISAHDLADRLSGLVITGGGLDSFELDNEKAVHMIVEWATARSLSEMRGICGGEVGEITRTPEEQAALERAMEDVAKATDPPPQHLTDVVDGLLRPLIGSLRATQMAVTIFHALGKQGALIEVPVDAPPDENALPMEMLPEGWHFEYLHRQLSYKDGIKFDSWDIMIQCWQEVRVGRGPTPRAAMIAAIEAARERGDG